MNTICHKLPLFADISHLSCVQKQTCIITNHGRPLQNQYRFYNNFGYERYLLEDMSNIVTFESFFANPLMKASQVSGRWDTNAATTWKRKQK